MLDKIPEETLIKLFSNVPMAEPEVLHKPSLTPEFLEHIQTEIPKTLPKLKKRPTLNDYLRELELVVEKDRYVKDHIQLVTVISACIAKGLELETDESLEKNVYASYLHEASFVKHPKLVRIHSMK